MSTGYQAICPQVFRICPLFNRIMSAIYTQACPRCLLPPPGTVRCLPPNMYPLFTTPYVRCLSPLCLLAVYHPYVRCLPPLSMCPQFRKGDCQPFTLQKLTTGYKPITSSLQAAGLVTPQQARYKGFVMHYELASFVTKLVTKLVTHYEYLFRNEARYEARNAPVWFELGHFQLCPITRFLRTKKSGYSS